MCSIGMANKTIEAFDCGKRKIYILYQIQQQREYGIDHNHRC